MAFPYKIKNVDPDNDGGAPDTPALERQQAAKGKKKKTSRMAMMAKFAAKK